MMKELYESYNKAGFEAWAKDHELDIEPYTFNPKFADELDYQDIVTQIFWECWRASFIAFARLVVDKKK